MIQPEKGPALPGSWELLEHSSRTPPLPPRKDAPVSGRRKEHSFGNSDGSLRDQDVHDAVHRYDDLAQPTQGEGQNGNTQGKSTLHPGAVPIPPMSQHHKEDKVANIVIFGETGVGKSSLINLIADEKLTRISNDAIGCTFHHEQYLVPLDDILCVIWDTMGLDEGSEGSIPAKEAESNLRTFMQDLAHSGGIHLIIYCIRGTRLTKALKRNYDLFYATVCRKKVPVALVATGLEHQEGEMETWWAQNELALRRNGMWFDAHACVTTITVEDDVIKQRRLESRTVLCDLIREYSKLPGWKADASLISRVLPMFQNILRGLSPRRNTMTIRKMTVCGSFSKFLPGTTAVWDKTIGRIGNAEYQFLRVDKLALLRNTPRVLQQDEGVLVFYTSPLVDNHVLQQDFDALKRFYDIAGGQSCPLIIVLQDCDDERVAAACRTQITSRCGFPANFVSISSIKDTGALDDMIERFFIEQTEGKTSTQSFLKLLQSR